MLITSVTMINRFAYVSLALVLAGCANNASYTQSQSVPNNHVLPILEAVKTTYRKSPISPTSTSVTITNLNPFPYIVRVQIFNDFGRTQLVGEKVVTLEPQISQLVEVSADNGKTFDREIYVRTNWQLGDNRYAKNPTGFIIPFPKGVNTTVCQYMTGKITTHQKHPEAIDFCAPLDTPIVAAKSGMVTDAVGTFTEGGKDPSYYDKSNYVNILHDDGTVSNYGHMAPNSLTVKPGDYVKQGDVIGKVGLTGQTSGPHLHMGLWYKNNNFDTINLLPQFVTNGKKPLQLRQFAVVSQDGNPYKEPLKWSPESSKVPKTADEASSLDSSIDRKTLERKESAPNEITNSKKMEVADSTSFNLGNEAYRNGDYKKAFMYFSKSARTFNPEAQLNLGLLYLNGEGVTKDDANAYLWLEIASRSSNPKVRHNAGQWLFRLAGRMDSKDLVIAKKLVAACKNSKLADCGR